MSSTCLVHTTYEWGMIIGPILFAISASWFFTQAFRNWRSQNKLGLLNFSLMGLACLYAAYTLVIS